MGSAERRTYHHRFETYLKDSNATGNIYFARYFEWQGVCRERWFHDCISADMLSHEGVFVTKRAHLDFLHETYAFDHVRCALNTYAVRQCSFHLLFCFSTQVGIVARGFQEMVFRRPERGIARLPADVIALLRSYELSHSSSALRG